MNLDCHQTLQPCVQRLGAGAAPTVHGTYGIDKTPVPQLGATLLHYTRTLLVDDGTFIGLWPFTKYSQG